MLFSKDETGQWWAEWDGRRARVPARTCEFCGKEFASYPSSRLQKFCSRDCFGRAAAGKAVARRPSYICEQCGKEYWRLDKRGAMRFCSRACSGAARTGKRVNSDELARQCPVCGAMFERVVRRPWRMTCGNPKCRRALATPSGEQHRNWNGGEKFVDRLGYVRVHTANGRQLEHRVVMEEILGRPLERFEEVHHRNAVRSDNRPENLELWVKRQPGGARAKDLIDYARWILETYGPAEGRL